MINSRASSGGGLPRVIVRQQETRHPVEKTNLFVYVTFFACVVYALVLVLRPTQLHRRSGSEIVFGAIKANDLRPEPRNVHEFGAAGRTLSSYGV